MDRQQPLPVGKREIHDRFDDLNTGIADQHIDPAVFRHRVGDTLLDRRLVGDIHADGKGIRAFRLDLPRSGVGSVEIEIGDDRRAALGGKAQRDLLADAAGRTGDDGHLSSKTGHCDFLSA